MARLSSSGDFPFSSFVNAQTLTMERERNLREPHHPRNVI